MAFMNKAGIKISYDCRDLINELRQDIEEFGGSMFVDVVTEKIDGVTIYKDYNFIENDPATEFKLRAGEELVRMTATSLMDLYRIENELM